MKSQSFVADRALIQALEKLSRPVICSEGRTLFAQGEFPNGIYVIERGEAELVLKSPAGRTVLCLHADSGSVLGLPGVIAGEPYSMTAMSSKGSQVGYVTRDDFEKFIEAKPSLYPVVLQVLAAEVRSARLALCDT
jgi:CRP-like cAMP-binding protein